MGRRGMFWDLLSPLMNFIGVRDDDTSARAPRGFLDIERVARCSVMCLHYLSRSFLLYLPLSPCLGAYMHTASSPASCRLYFVP